MATATASVVCPQSLGFGTTPLSLCPSHQEVMTAHSWCGPPGCLTVPHLTSWLFHACAPIFLR